jgi:hypothetical protein
MALVTFFGEAFVIPVRAFAVDFHRTASDAACWGLHLLQYCHDIVRLLAGVYSELTSRVRSNTFSYSAHQLFRLLVSCNGATDI